LVLRLLDRERVMIGLEDLGFSTEILRSYERLINRSSGIILITGPTGSGKTTTLYASLSSMNSSEKNILTVEDPIEYQLNGIGQMQVNPKVGLTFARGLRHILRQDPDIIMVGEIRDRETAEMAIQAALTGHLVLSTLHTNDSAGAVSGCCVHDVRRGMSQALMNIACWGSMARSRARPLTSCTGRPAAMNVSGPAISAGWGSMNSSRSTMTYGKSSFGEVTPGVSEVRRRRRQ
jgi:Tfp pilus assembly pilus retraction ATPase PilT